jgi:tRNA pseudouridine38-40 synthase
VRRIFSSRVLTAGASAREPLITYEVRGDGFLRHMVRSIVGTLVEVGRGREPVVWINEVLASCDRRRAGRTAPPAGLFLVRVEYE